MEGNTQSLSQLNLQIKNTLSNRFSDLQWVVAEISDMNLNRSGHCYLELIEKDTVSQKIIAKARATIWAFAFRMIKPYFETTTGEPFRAGIKVLLRVSVEFHEIYGFSLNVQDIDPQYTLGDMARKKAEILKKLKDEGVIDMNKSLPLPRVPQRIAVISSETAAGYGDFMNQLEHNSYGFQFDVHLFPAIMQGDKTAASIMQALEQVFDALDAFDVVVIIRGGGAKSELSSFDDYDLAYLITQCPLPVLSGIGHERDNTVVDEVSHTRLKTPTAVAEFLLDTCEKFYQYLDVLQTNAFTFVVDYLDQKEQDLDHFSESLNNRIRRQLEDQRVFLIESRHRLKRNLESYLQQKTNKLDRNRDKVGLRSQAYLTKYNQELNRYHQQFLSETKAYLAKKEQKLELMQSKNKLMDPQYILNRGFAYVTGPKGLVKTASQVHTGDAIRVHLAKGDIDAEVI